MTLIPSMRNVDDVETNEEGDEAHMREEGGSSDPLRDRTRWKVLLALP